MLAVFEAMETTTGRTKASAWALVVHGCGNSSALNDNQNLATLPSQAGAGLSRRAQSSGCQHQSLSSRLPFRRRKALMSLRGISVTPWAVPWQQPGRPWGGRMRRRCGRCSGRPTILATAGNTPASESSGLRAALRGGPGMWAALLATLGLAAKGAPCRRLHCRRLLEAGRAARGLAAAVCLGSGVKTASCAAGSLTAAGVAAGTSRLRAAHVVTKGGSMHRWGITVADRPGEGDLAWSSHDGSLAAVPDGPGYAVQIP